MNIPKLTDKRLKTFKPQEKRYRVYIDNQPGLYLLVGVTGNITFQFRYQVAGQRRNIKIGSYPARSMQNLLSEYADFVDLVKQGTDPLREREITQQRANDNPFFKDFAERFILQYVQKKLAPDTAREYKRQIRKHFIPAWGKYKVIDIQRKHIVKLVEKISDKTPVQGNRCLATIKKMLNYALDVGIINVNPATRIKKPGKETPRTRVLDLEEITTLFKMLETLPDRDTRDILRLIALTAQRPGEVAEMHLSQLKEDAAGLWFQIEASGTKNSEPTRIFLNDMAAAIIKARIDDMGLTKYIFPAQPGFMRKDVLVNKVQAIQPALQAQGVDYFTAHDLRRSAATGLARLGHGLIIDDVLNHKQKGITRQVYDLYSRAPEIKRALTAWGEAVQRAITGNQGDVIEINS